jgi:hypothetical protein
MTARAGGCDAGGSIPDSAGIFRFGPPAVGVGDKVDIGGNRGVIADPRQRRGLSGLRAQLVHLGGVLAGCGFSLCHSAGGPMRKISGGIGGRSPPAAQPSAQPSMCEVKSMRTSNVQRRTSK